MEYCSGGSVESYLNTKSPDQSDRMQLFPMILNGFSQIYQANIVHRDINPRNLVICDNDVVKYIDFGSAAFLEKEKQIKNQVEIQGALEYLSPQVAKKYPYDFQAEIWTLGILLHKLILNKTPFDGISTLDELKQKQRQKLQFSATINHPLLIDLLEGMLQYLPEKRLRPEEVLGLFKIQHYEVHSAVPIDHLAGYSLNVCGETYHLQKKIGQGSSGVIYKAVSPTGYVAIKMIDLTQEAEQYVKNEIFLMERAADHPNIVELYCSEKKRSMMYLVMEYCSRGDLASHIANKLSQDEIQGYLVDLVKGFQHLYEMNILHRDLKPKNLFLTSENVLKIGDFGVSIPLRKREEASDEISGTLEYLGPEVLGYEPYGYKSDMWSIAICLYKMYTGSTPFERDIDSDTRADDGPAMLSNIWNLESSVEDLTKDIDPKHAKIIRNVLKSDPKERPSVELFIYSIIGGKKPPCFSLLRSCQF